MANQDIAIPKFYPDIINHLMATGTAQDGNFDLISGTDLITTINTGSEAELFDMNPLNQVVFETSASSTTRADHVLLNIDTTGDYKIDFVAILNHNLSSCDGQFRICHSNTEANVDSSAEIEDGTATKANNVTQVLNANSITQNLVNPNQDGSTIVSFDASDDQYWALQFEGSNSNNFDATNDLKIGCVIIGESYTMPHAPDLNIKRSIIYDGVNMQESLGGQRYTVSTQTGKQFIDAQNRSPFTLAGTKSRVYNGRLSYEFTTSFLNSSDVMPNYWSGHVANTPEDTIIGDLFNRTLGNRLPFIFQVDSTSTGASDFIYSRFVDNSVEMTQVANKMFNINFKIEEEF